MKRPICFFVMVGLLAATIVMANSRIPDEIDLAVVRTAENAEARAALEAECLAVVTSEDEVTFADRFRAFRILEVIATERSIEPLIPLLDDPERSHLARAVLEKLPGETVDRYLLDALDSTSGKVRLGIMSTLGVRRTSSAVEPLSALLGHEDTATATGAADVLGRIGTPPALSALQARLDEATDRERRFSLYNAILAAAERIEKEGDASVALAAYAPLLQTDRPEHVRAGAFRGVLTAQPLTALDLAYRAIHGDDALFRGEAIAFLSEMDGDRVASRLANDFDSFSREMKVVLLEMFAEWRTPVALAAVNQAVRDGDSEVRSAAIRAIGEVGDPSSIEPLGRLLGETNDTREQREIVESLRRMEAEGMNAELIAYLHEASLPARPHIITALAQRNAVEAVDAIMAQIENVSLRAPAFRALEQLARPEDLPAMLTWLAELEGESGRRDAISAIVSLSRRIVDEDSAPIIVRAVYGDLPDGAMVDVTDRISQIVAQGRSDIRASNQIAGDPAPGIVKMLRIDYELNGEVLSVTGREGEDLHLSRGTSTAAVDLVVAALNSVSDNEAITSFLRVLSGIGGHTAFEAVVRYLHHDDARIHDGAVRSLADWPDPDALDLLVSLSRHAPESAHRTVTLRGAVRLLRTMDPSCPGTVSRYVMLTGNDRSAGELMLIFSGLSEVAHPAGLRLLEPYLDNDDVSEEALIAFRRIAATLEINEEAAMAGRDEGTADTAGFVSLFNGEDLSEWSGDPAFWRVDDGHIVGQTEERNPLAHNSFLVRDQVESDFDLKFSYRIDSPQANSGVQVRSEEFEQYRVRGYQPDIATDDWITGICYEEGGRGILARRGQRVSFAEDGTTEVHRFAEEDSLGEFIHLHEWNEYRVIALGNRVLTLINGRLMHEVIDDAPSARDSGIIAFQLHTGPPMEIRFKDIRLKRLSD